MRLNARVIGALVTTLWFLPFPLIGQSANTSSASSVLSSDPSAGFICPGQFPTDLTVTNCEYTQRQRLQQWFTTSFSDQAMLGAIVYGAGAQIIKSPGEWGRTWGGYGNRIGVRYAQGAARGTAELLVGTLMRDDPRHLSYKDDPNSHYGIKITPDCSPGRPIQSHDWGIPDHLLLRRIGHSFLDSVTVRRSNTCGVGRRLPAIDRLVGVAASAYAGYPIYPQSENGLANIGQRAAGAYGSTLVGSFYTEFSPEISLLVGKLFVRNSAKAKAP